MNIEASRMRVYRRQPTSDERRRLEQEQFVGSDLRLRHVPNSTETPNMAEEALMERGHPYIFSDGKGPSELVVAASSIAHTLRNMHPDDRPSSLQYQQAAVAFDDLAEVFVVPYSMTESAV